MALSVGGFSVGTTVYDIFGKVGIIQEIKGAWIVVKFAHKQQVQNCRKSYLFLECESDNEYDSDSESNPVTTISHPSPKNTTAHSTSSTTTPDNMDDMDGKKRKTDKKKTDETNPLKKKTYGGVKKSPKHLKNMLSTLKSAKAV